MPYIRAVWHGTEEEKGALLRIIHDNCPSSSKCAGQPTAALCGAHQLLLEQRYLDGLLFTFRSNLRIIREEWKECRS